MGFYYQYNGTLKLDRQVSDNLKKVIDRVTDYYAEGPCLYDTERIKKYEPNWKAYCINGELGKNGEYWFGPEEKIIVERIKRKPLLGFIDIGPKVVTTKIPYRKLELSENLAECCEGFWNKNFQYFSLWGDRVTIDIETDAVDSLQPDEFKDILENFIAIYLEPFSYKLNGQILWDTEDAWEEPPGTIYVEDNEIKIVPAKMSDDGDFDEEDYEDDE